MTQDLSVHVFGVGEWPDEGSPIRSVTRHAGDRPDAALLADIFRNADGDLAFVRFDGVRSQRLANLAPAADATVLLTDPAVGGRGSAELAAALWRSAPAVALYLGDDPLAAGAIVFSRTAVGSVEMKPSVVGDAIVMALTDVLAAGGRIAAVVADEVESSLPSEPPILAPSPPSRSRRWLADLIRRADPGRRLGGERDSADAAAVSAGLLLWHDFLDESHAVSQAIEGEGTHCAGDFWHAIMHRRERDYGNAKYWFRRVGPHPVFETLADRAACAVAGEVAADRVLVRVVAGGQWEATAFVDACAEAERTGDADLDRVLRLLQAEEMLLLLGQTVRDAIGV